MGKVKMSKTYGIHTIELYAKKLKYAEVQKVIDYLMDKGKIQEIKSDPYNIDRQLKSTYFVNDGLRLRIYQSHNKSNGIAFIINPCTLLTGKYQPLCLWEPTQKSVKLLLDRLSNTVTELGIDFIDPENLSLSEMDLTENHWFGRICDPSLNICIIRKGIIPPNFETINNAGNIPKDRLYGIKTNRIAIKLYDKIYELKVNNRCPKSLEDKNILRFEISLKREAFLKKFDLKRDASLYKMLRTGFENGKNLMTAYLDKIFPFSGKLMRYKSAKELVEEKVTDSTLQAQMLHLLKKTSDSAGLDAATRKLKEHYTDVDHRQIKKIYAKFDELGISPITLPKNLSRGITAAWCPGSAM